MAQSGKAIEIHTVLQQKGFDSSPKLESIQLTYVPNVCIINFLSKDTTKL